MVEKLDLANIKNKIKISLINNNNISQKIIIQNLDIDMMRIGDKLAKNMPDATK